VKTLPEADMLVALTSIGMSPETEDTPDPVIDLSHFKEAKKLPNLPLLGKSIDYGSRQILDKNIRTWYLYLQNILKISYRYLKRCFLGDERLGKGGDSF